MRQGDSPAARNEYLRSLALDPKQSRVHAMLGTISLLDNDLDGGRALLPAGARHHPRLRRGDQQPGDDRRPARRRRRGRGAGTGRRSPPIPPSRASTGAWPTSTTSAASSPRRSTNYRKTLAAEPDDFAALVQAGNSARHAGDATGRRRLFARAAHLRPDSWIPVYNQACLAAVGGDPVQALKLLDKLREKRFTRTELLAGDPDLAAVRKLPGFAPVKAALEARAADLRKRVGEENEWEDDAAEP